MQLGRGDVAAALRASPLVVLGAALWVLWPRLGPALARRTEAAQRRRAGLAALVVVLLASEAWQLQRLLG